MLEGLNKKIASLKPLFEPASIAIIGASADLRKPSGQPVAALVNNGFAGRIYPVNPKYKEINGLKCYPDPASIPGPVDLAIIAVPAALTLQALKDCAAKGVTGVIIFTSGFGEVGEEGKRQQDELARVAREAGMRLCGPNCMGIFSAHNRLMANFAVMELPGRVLIKDFFGFVSQSGGFGAAIYQTVKERGIGFSHFISTGNEADVEFSEYLAYMAGDSHTKVIGGYLEGVKNGRQLVEAADLALQVRKPVMLIKAGKFAPAARAAASHTGSMVGSEKVYSSFFRQKGITRVESLEELVMALSILAAGKLPGGNRVAVLATSGGRGVMLADKCSEFGLDVVNLAPETRARLDQLLPSFASTANPVDITSQIMTHPGLLQSCAEIVLSDPDVDAMVVAYWALHGDTTNLDQMINVSRNSSKPVVNLVWGLEEATLKAIHYLQDQLVPATQQAEYAVKALGNLSRYSMYLAKRAHEAPASPVPEDSLRRAAEIMAEAKQDGRLAEHRAKSVLREMGIPTTREELATTLEEALASAGKIGYPVALKIDSPDILHKTDAGGLFLNVKTPGELAEKYPQILANANNYNQGAKINGILVQEMLPPGTEVIVGIARDETFGPTVVFGLGGIFVEALDDIAVRVAPLTPTDAREMIEEVKGYRLLQGMRGAPAGDIDAIVEVILRVSQMAMNLPALAELDINPLMVYPRGIIAADAVIILKDNAGSQESSNQ
ncbi:MAG: acetate--CoA ligase family protein [Bacillota bacterium]